MGYLYFKGQMVPINEIERVLRVDNKIIIQTEDTEVYRFEFDNEEQRDAAYDEIISDLQMYFGLRD